MLCLCGAWELGGGGCPRVGIAMQDRQAPQQAEGLRARGLGRRAAAGSAQEDRAARSGCLTLDDPHCARPLVISEATALARTGVAARAENTLRVRARRRRESARGERPWIKSVSRCL